MVIINFNSLSCMKFDVRYPKVSLMSDAGSIRVSLIVSNISGPFEAMVYDKIGLTVRVKYIDSLKKI